MCACMRSFCVCARACVQFFSCACVVFFRVQFYFRVYGFVVCVQFLCVCSFCVCAVLFAVFVVCMRVVVVCCAVVCMRGVVVYLPCVCSFL